VPEAIEPTAAEPVGETADTPSEETAPADAPADAADEEPPPAPAPVDLGPDARYSATGKRKSSVARVIVRPGGGAFDLNGRSIDEYFPRAKHRAVVREPLAVTGYLERVDVRARIHGGGVGGQADAVRHGIAKALIEADPNLRGELKRRQLLTRDPRVKERRKAGLKKARKRPQFSKR
jgi:small subunit ribosomal protein S9